jgi:hypothetical protein
MMAERTTEDRVSGGVGTVGTPLVPEPVLDELMERVEGEGAELLGPDGLLSQVTKGWSGRWMRN